MDEIERRLFEDVKSELVMCKHEKQRLSEKLDCLIILLRRAWRGENESIAKLSEIVGIPAPKIIPCEEDISSNDQMGQEYLQITSSLLDEQLKEDSTIRKKTKTLRPSSAKCLRPTTEKVNQRPKSCKVSRQRKPPMPLQSYENGVEIKPEVENFPNSQLPMTVNDFEASTVDNFAMAELADILPMFSRENNAEKDSRDPEMKSVRQPRRQVHRKKPPDLFNPEPVVGLRKARPLSAALQQRQDYLRSQTKKRKPRPHTAKPVFNFTEIESESPSNSRLLYQSPASSPEDKDNFLVVSPRGIDTGSQLHPISVDISKKNAQRRKVVTANRNFFPQEKDDEPFGDVADALQRVQEMQRQFRLNTRRLQEKIGIPDAGFV